MESSDWVNDESTEDAPAGGDVKHSALFNVVVVVLSVAFALTILIVGYFEVMGSLLWFGSGETWSGFPWILVLTPIVALLVLGALFALGVRWAARRPRAGTARPQPGAEAHNGTTLSDAIDRTAITEEHYQASLDQHLASLFQRRRRRAITETEYQTQLLEVRRLMSQGGEGTTEDEKH